MYKKEKKLNLDINNIDKTIDKVNKLRKAFVKFRDELEIGIDFYMRYLLSEIKKKSLKYLDSEDTFLPSLISDIREKIEATLNFEKNGDFTYTLWYNSEHVTFIEFGTGLVGKNNPHPMAYSSPKYRYASGNVISKKGYWTWYIPEEYRRIVIDNKGNSYEQVAMTTKGYEGRQFIYKAFRDIINSELYIKVYDKVVSHILKRNFK